MLDILRRTVGAGPHFFRLISDNLRSITGIFHVYSIDRGLRKDYCPQDHHFLISAEELTWRKGDPLLCGCGYADQLVALL